MFGRIKELKGKDKIEYYLEYYGWRTVGVIAVVSIFIFLVIHFTTSKEIVSGILAINCDGTSMNAVDGSYFDDLLSEMGYDTSKSTMTVNCSMYVKADYEDSVTRTNMETIQTMFVTGSVDVLLADEEFFVAVAQSDYLADLSEILTDEEIQKNEDNLVYATNMITNERILAGIRVSNSSEWMAETGWYKDGAVIGLASLRKSDKLAIEILRRAIGES